MTKDTLRESFRKAREAFDRFMQLEAGTSNEHGRCVRT
jgi:hypothetical protein